jgi:HsdM N-terminal domain
MCDDQLLRAVFERVRAAGSGSCSHINGERETVALKKSELYSSLWSGCDELRGGMDASQYKDYVLVLLFIKYVSDKYAGVPTSNPTS